MEIGGTSVSTRRSRRLRVNISGGTKQGASYIYIDEYGQL